VTSLNSKIKKNKLSLSFLLIIVLFLIFGVITIRGLLTLGNLTRTIYEHPLVVSNASLIAALNITKMHRNMKDVVLASYPEEVKGALKVVAENENEVYRQLDIVREVILGREGQDLEKQTRQLFSDWKPIRQEVVGLLESGNKKDAILITKAKGADHVLKLETKMLELTSYARKKADNFLGFAETSQSKLENITLILTISGVLLSVIIAFFTTHLVGKAQKELQNQKNKLQKALDEIKTLRGIIPICSHCKQIRDDEGSWQRIEEYIHSHSEAQFSHGICPGCMKKHYPEHYESIYPDEK
jgi:preprotein translocase subunit YajC